MITPLEYFALLVQQDDCIPLFEAALVIGQDATPDLDLEAIMAEFDVMVAKLQRCLPHDASVLHKLRVLNNYFFGELGFSLNVNDYYDPDNSYLHRVIASRAGIPVSLALIYLELAQQIGLPMQGISFPGHFLLKMHVQMGDIILDPLDGSSLSREDLEERLEPFMTQQTYPAGMPMAAFLKSASSREILARMLHNLRIVFVRAEDWPRILGVQQRLVILLPDDLIVRRDRGLAYANLECPAAAIDDLQAYLAKYPYANDARDLRAQLPQLRAAVKRMND